MGDLNVDQLKSDSPNYKKLKHFLQEHNLEACTMPFTRISTKTVSSLDFCITNLHLQNIKTETHRNLISDHLGVCCTLLNYNQNNNIPFKKTMRHVTQENLNELKGRLKQQRWEEVYKVSAVDTQYDNFIRIIQNEMNGIMPRTTKTFKTRLTKIFWDEPTRVLKKP